LFTVRASKANWHLYHTADIFFKVWTVIYVTDLAINTIITEIASTVFIH